MAYPITHEFLVTVVVNPDAPNPVERAGLVLAIEQAILSPDNAYFGIEDVTVIDYTSAQLPRTMGRVKRRRKRPKKQV